MGKLVGSKEGPFAIYLIQSDQWFYIGSAWNKTAPEDRLRRHRAGRGGARKLAVRLAAGDSHEFLVLERGDGFLQDAYDAEQKWLDRYRETDPRECLNINVFPAKLHGWSSPETTGRLVSEALRGRPRPDISAALTGRKRPDLSWGDPGSPKHDAHRAAIKRGMDGMSTEAAELRSQRMKAAAIGRRPPSRLGTKNPSLSAKWADPVWRAQQIERIRAGKERTALLKSE